MNRLTPEIVAAAFAQIGAVPARLMSGPSPFDRPGSPVDHCCGIYAVLAARGCPFDAEARYAAQARRLMAHGTGLDLDYAHGFAWGWDCGQINSNARHSEEYLQGYIDGREAWMVLDPAAWEQFLAAGREARRA